MNATLRTLSLLAIVFTLSGCGKEPTAPPVTTETPPALPPASSMQVDFGFFDRNGAAQVVAEHPGGVEVQADRSHWINAVVRVVFINLTVADLLEEPWLALHAALSQKATLGDDGWWTWVFAFRKDDHDVTLRLRARIDGGLVTWRMLVTDPSVGLANFPWFNGETQLANDSGFWLFHAPVGGEPVDVARIDWSNASLTQRQLSFRNVVEGSPEFGDQLEYRLEGAAASLTFHDASAATDATIEWNETSGRGSIHVPDYNGGERGCWDEQLQNTVCEPSLVATSRR